MKRTSKAVIAWIVLAGLLAPQISPAIFTQTEDCHTTYLSSRQVDADGSTPTVAYENLSEHQQAVFRRTLNESSVAVSAETMQNLSGTKVQYNGAYYLLTEGHAECSMSPIPPLVYDVVTFVVLGLLGLVAAIGYRHFSNDK